MICQQFKLPESAFINKIQLKYSEKLYFKKMKNSIILIVELTISTCDIHSTVLIQQNQNKQTIIAKSLLHQITYWHDSHEPTKCKLISIQALIIWRKHRQFFAIPTRHICIIISIISDWLRLTLTIGIACDQLSFLVCLDADYTANKIRLIIRCFYIFNLVWIILHCLRNYNYLNAK